MPGPHSGSTKLIDEPTCYKLCGVVTRQDWGKVEAAFHQVLLLEAHHRDTFIAGFAAREPELEPLLRALLAADAEGDHRLLDEVAMFTQSVLHRRR